MTLSEQLMKTIIELMKGKQENTMKVKYLLLIIMLVALVACGDSGTDNTASLLLLLKQTGCNENF